MSYLKINQDDSKPRFEALDLPYDPLAWFYACHDVIGCSTIQTVPTVFPGLHLVIDEEGKLFDEWQSRINVVATILSGSLLDPVVGDAILVREYVEDLGPLTSDDVNRLRRYWSDVPFIVDEGGLNYGKSDT